MGMAKDVLGKPFGVLPFLRFFPPFKAKFKKLSKSFKDFEAFIRETVDEHEITFDKNNPRDFVDMFLLQIEADNSNIFNKKQLIRFVKLNYIFDIVLGVSGVRIKKNISRNNDSASTV